MKSTALKFVSLLLFILIQISANGQQGVHTSGGNATGAGGSVSYSVGQVFYASQTSTAGTLIQGVQHPYELVVTETKTLSSLVICEVFPNPVVKELMLKVSGEIPGNTFWKLIDLRGVSLLNGTLNQAETILPLSGLPNATYSLQLYSGNKELQTFKIVKQ